MVFREVSVEDKGCFAVEERGDQRSDNSPTMSCPRKKKVVIRMRGREKGRV